MTNPVITNVDNTSIFMGGNTFISVTALSGEVWVQGQMIGVVTASGKYKETDSANTDGSQLVRAVAAVAVDASAGDILTKVCITGQLDQSLLVFSRTDTLDTVPSGTTDSYRLQLRDFGMFAEQFDDTYIVDNQ